MVFNIAVNSVSEREDICSAIRFANKVADADKSVVSIMSLGCDNLAKRLKSSASSHIMSK